MRRKFLRKEVFFRVSPLYPSRGLPHNLELLRGICETVPFSFFHRPRSEATAAFISWSPSDQLFKKVSPSDLNGRFLMPVAPAKILRDWHLRRPGLKLSLVLVGSSVKEHKQHLENSRLSQQIQIIVSLKSGVMACSYVDIPSGGTVPICNNAMLS